MSRRTSLPAVPDVGPGLDPAAADILRPVKEIIEVREGRRGDVLDRVVTLRDLIDLGLVSTEQAERTSIE